MDEQQQPGELPPMSALLKLTREALDITTTELARMSGVSKGRISQIENGMETRDGVTRPSQGRPPTVAKLATALKIPADQVEQEGGDKAAADIMRMQQRMQRPTPYDGTIRPPVPSVPPAPAISPDEAGAEREYAALMFRAAPEDIHLLQILSRAIDAEGKLYPWSYRLSLAKTYLRRGEEDTGRAAGTA